MAAGSQFVLVYLGASLDHCCALQSLSDSLLDFCCYDLNWFSVLPTVLYYSQLAVCHSSERGVCLADQSSHEIEIELKNTARALN